MPLQIPLQEFDDLLRIIAARVYGASVKELLANAELRFPKRTLQRRLDQLVSEKRLQAQGQGRARRYIAPRQNLLPMTPSVVREDPPVYKIGHDWLSPEALEIRRIIQLPLAQRTPVNYQGSFLDRYRPNKTFYLPESLRNELGEIGQVGMSRLPAGTYLRQVMDRLLIDLSWNSSRLEGNTYSLLETQRLLELGEDAEGKGTQETQMILNHKAAIEMLADDAGEPPGGGEIDLVHRRERQQVGALRGAAIELALGVRDEHRPVAARPQAEHGQKDLLLSPAPGPRGVDVEGEHSSQSFANFRPT